jgi:hypothetical protein
VKRVALALACTTLALAGCAGTRSRSALATTSYGQTYLAASHNWVFRKEYPRVDRLFNAFDYGHAVLYETLLRADSAGQARILEERELPFITERLLSRGPRVPLEERAIAPTYATLVPEVVAMFEWAHVLHRQLYDVLADRRIWPSERDARVREVIRYYRSRRDLAFSASPKGMELMEGQPYSLAFRRRAPRFNGLLWSYHWMQMALYDALLVGDSSVTNARSASIDATLAHFRKMSSNGASGAPTVMPMSPAVAPRFSELYPEAAIVFDNLHSFHDVVADILASSLIAPADKRAAILRAAAVYRDSTTSVTSREAWIEMSHAMGVEQMGGPAPVVDPLKR